MFHFQKWGVFFVLFFCCQYYCNLCNRGNISWNLLYIFVMRHTQKSAPLDAFFKKKEEEEKRWIIVVSAWKTISHDATFQI